MTVQKHCLLKAKVNDSKHVTYFSFNSPLFLQGIPTVFWYLKIPSKPNEILGISSGRNDGAETLSFQSEFQ
jgi:hypothetical protein